MRAEKKNERLLTKGKKRESFDHPPFCGDPSMLKRKTGERSSGKEVPSLPRGGGKKRENRHH